MYCSLQSNDHLSIVSVHYWVDACMKNASWRAKLQDELPKGNSMLGLLHSVSSYSFLFPEVSISGRKLEATKDKQKWI